VSLHADRTNITHFTDTDVPGAAVCGRHLSEERTRTDAICQDCYRRNPEAFDVRAPSHGGLRA